MTRRMKIWLVVASLFTLINVGGGFWAARLGEGAHAGVHVVLTFVGAWWIWRLVRRAPEEERVGARQVDGKIQQLQESVDAIAIEVERIGEAQRFTAKLAAEKAGAVPPKPRP